MTGCIQCIYLFACEYMSLWLINVDIMSIALINIDPLVFQFDSINLFQTRSYFHVTEQCNREMNSPYPYLNCFANRIYSYFMTCGMKM